MATSPFSNPLLERTGVSDVPRPFAPWTPTSDIGIGGLAPSLADMTLTGERLIKASQFTMPEMRKPTRPNLGFSPTTNELFVNGLQFSADDAATALQSEQYLGAAPKPLPSGDWIPLNEAQYGQYLQSIRKPSLGQLASKSFGRGVDSMQMLAGRGLQLAGAEELGGRIVEQQMEDLRKTTPYERQFTDIESGRGAVEWLVANFAQQGPNMIESIATAAAGFLAGTAASGNPFGGAAAAVAATIGKTAWKESVKAALKKKAAGEALDKGEDQLLRKAAGVGMATAATFGQSLATGASDIYGELRDQGADADDISARLKALGGSIPYALADTLPEYLLFSRLLGRGARPGLGTLATRRAKAGEILKRGAVGGGVGGGAEGLGELTQEALLLGLSDQDFSSTENINRLVNSFAAGAGVGGPIGAGANIFNPTNLLKPGESTDPSASAPKVQPTPKTELTVPGTQLTVQPRPEFAGTYGQGAGTFISGAGGTYMPSDSRELVPTYAPVTPLGAAPGAPLQLPPPVQTLTPMGGPVIMAGMGPGAADVTRQDILLRQQGNVPPGAAPGSQGVLDVFGGTIPAQELSARMQPQAPLLGLPPPVAAPVVNPAQGALQFSGEAPTLPANTQMGNQLQVIQDRRRRQQEFDAVQAQQAADIQQQTEALAQQSANARDLFAMQQGQPPAPFPSRPMVTVQPTQPRQLPLFTRKQAPVPPKAGQLRRGGRMAAPVAPEAVATDETTPQVPLFDEAQEAAPKKPAAKKAAPKKPAAKKTAGADNLKKGKTAKAAADKAAADKAAADKAAADKAAVQMKAAAFRSRKTGEIIETGPVHNRYKLPGGYASDLKEWEAGFVDTNNTFYNREEAARAIGSDKKELRTEDFGATTGLQPPPVKQDNAGVQDGGDAGDKPATEVKTGGTQTGGGGVALKRGKKAPEQPLTTAKAQELLDDLGIDPDTTKAKVMALAKRMRDANLIDDGDINSLSRISKDRDMGPEDLISELQSSLNAAATDKAAAKKAEDEKTAKDAARDANLAKIVKKAETVQAGKQWSAYADRDTQPKWDELTPEQQEQWRKVVIDDGKPNMRATEEIAPPKKAEAAVAAVPASDADLDAGLRRNADDSNVAALLLADALVSTGHLASEMRDIALVYLTKGVAAGRKYLTDLVNNPDSGFGLVEMDAAERAAYIQETNNFLSQKTAIFNAAAPAVIETPAEAWDAMDTGVEWAKLSPGQQTEWTDSKRTQAVADIIAETPEAKWSAMSDVPWENLSDELKKKWGDAKVRDDDLVDEIESDAKVENDVEAAVADAVDKLRGAITDVENSEDMENAFRIIANYAYFTVEETNTKDLVESAQAYINETNFSDVQKYILRTVTIELANLATKSGHYAKYKSGIKKDTFKPWYTLLSDAGLLGNLTIDVKGLTLPEAEAAIAAGLDPEYLPKDTRKKLKKKPVAASVSRTVSPPIDYVEKLQNLINSLLDKSSSRKEAAVRKDAKEFYANISEQDRKIIYRSYPLSAFFDDNGEPKITKIGTRVTIGTNILSTDQKRTVETEQRATAKALAAAASAQYAQDRDRQQGAFEGRRGSALNDDPIVGNSYRDDGTPITSTIPIGRIRLLVSSFLSKLRIKPTTHIYANVADLKARNPKLYARAAAARAAGDFDTIAAVGYAFGPDVIIFSDFVRTEQQLKFVLAHESLGHFGFRSVVSGPVLDAMLNRIYDADYDVQAAVEAMMSVQGMSKLEAIEEYLADNAADLDSSVISKIWNVLKNALNKLGFEFQDDEARYLVNLARKYVRNGDVGHVVSSGSIAAGLDAINRASSTGRFARADAGNLVSRTLASVAAIQGSQSNYTGGLLGAANSFAQNVFGKRRDVPGVVARLLEELQTLDNKARRSYGLQQLHMMLEAQSGEAQQFLNKYKSMMEATYTPDVFGLAKGVSEDDKREAGKLLAHAALLRSRKVTDTFLKSFPDLIQLTSADQIDIPHLEAVRKQLEAAGEVTAEEFTKGFDIEYSALGADGKPLTKRFQYDVDTESNVWKVYQEARATINEAAIDMLLANFEASRAETNRVIGGLNNKRRGSNVFTDMDLAAIRRISNLYKATRYKSSSVSDASVRLDKQSLADAEALVQSFGRAIASDDIFAVWMKDPAAKGFIANDAVTKGSAITHAEFQKPEYDDIRAQLASLRSKVADIDASYIVQKAVRDVFLFDYQTRNAELYAKRTILGAYVPFARRGTEQVRLVAYDLDGNPAELSDDVRSTLPYFQFNDRSEAENAVADLEKEFGGDNEWTLTAPGPKGTLTPVTVKLVPEISRVRRTPDLTEAVNFNEFIYVLNRLNVNLTPTVRERIVTTLTSQNSRARKNLQRSGTEGWDTDVVRSVSEHLETSAHVAAKKMYRHRTDDILLNNSNWLGDSKLLKQLEAAVDNATDDGERARAQKAYDSYAYQYRYMAASSGMNKVTIAGKEVSTLGRGEDYREYAKEILRWYSENTNISESTEDILSGEVGSQLKLMAVVMQLGMSPASAVLNLVSLETHTIPYLAFYNPKHSFGGGYGWMKSATAVHTALANLRSPKLGDAAFLADLVAGKTKNTFGLSDAEISFLFDLSSKGVLQMSQANTMMGNARGKIFNNNMQGAIKTWMGMFTYTEQLTRRATALATFRLEKERALGQGIPEAQANAEATEAARVAVNTSQGDHNMYNRPKIGRGNITQFIFMYKMFLVNTVQLLRHMPKEGQLLMLGSLLLLSGMKGLPFAEDLMDIVDTIAQKLGLKTASAEKAMAEWIDTVAPGMSPYAMRGIVDRMTGATVSTRTGVGNMIPLTGVFKAGAQPGREIADFVGPVWGALAGSVGMAGNLLRYGADTVGLGNDTTSFNSIMRESPVAAFRSVGDGLAYLNDGRITNLRGQVVASDVSTNVILARFLGFYPAEATQANDIVRLSKQVADYAKSIKAEYIGAHIKADLRNDTAGVQQVQRNVDQWNQDAAGTGLEINNFAQSANRAAQESKRPLLQRYLKAAPKNVRPETEELMRIFGYN